jgi:hypothetical protein
MAIVILFSCCIKQRLSTLSKDCDRFNIYNGIADVQTLFFMYCKPYGNHVRSLVAIVHGYNGSWILYTLQGKDKKSKDWANQISFCNFWRTTRCCIWRSIAISERTSMCSNRKLDGKISKLYDIFRRDPETEPSSSPTHECTPPPSTRACFLEGGSVQNSRGSKHYFCLKLVHRLQYRTDSDDWSCWTTCGCSSVRASGGRSRQ